MRVLVTTTGFPGHVLPLLPFARACARAGHETCLVGPPPARAMVQDAGLEFCASAELPADEVRRVVGAASELPPEDGHAFMVEEGFGRVATRCLVRDVLQLVGAWRPDVVVRESQDFAGALAAERHGVRHVRVALGLADSEAETLGLVARVIAEAGAELGLDADADWLRNEPCLTLAPASLDDPQAAPAVHRFRVAKPPAPELPDWWMKRDGPLVYATFGSVAASLGYFPAFYRAVCDALADIPARVLLTVGVDVSDLNPLAANVHAERWIDQDAVLPHADAVLCHAGYGSAVGALAHGRPAVALPLFAGDQLRNARAVARSGAGVVVDGPRRAMFEPPPVDELPAAIGAVLADSSYRTAAERVAAEIAGLPPVDAAPDVLRAVMP